MSTTTTTAVADKPRDQPMAATEFQALTTFLTSKGLSSAQVAVAVGAAPSAKTRLELSQGLIAVLRMLPKQS
jgi:hypothetical protein